MGRPTPAIFELSVAAAEGEGEARLVAQWRRPGELAIRREQVLSVEPNQLEVELRAQVEAKGYGEVLGRAVFDGSVRELFAQARAEPGGLRILLTVEAAALQSLRWERLAGPFDDGQWRMLGQSQRFLLSQHLPSGSDRHFATLTRDQLRALVVVANPEPGNQFGVEPFDEAAAIDTVLGGLGEIPARVLGQDPRAEGPPTLDEICRCLTSERYSLLHIVAHGAFSRRSKGETAVFLHDEDGKTCAVKASRLIDRFKDLSTTGGLPHLAFLAVCDSAKPEAEGALGGLGQRMVRELGMPAVVAMTDRVSQQTAFTLGKGLYRRLSEHGEVDRALAQACVDVHEADDVVVPALFSRLAGEPLFTEAEARRLPVGAIVGGLAVLSAVGAGVALWGTSDPPEPAKEEPPAAVAPAVDPSMAQCVALARTDAFDFQSGLEVDFAVAQAGLGLSETELIEAEASADESTLAACERIYGMPQAFRVQIVDEDGLGIAKAEVTASGAAGLRSVNTARVDGRCSLQAPSWLQDGDEVQIEARRTAEDRPVRVERTLAELRTGTVTVTLSSQDRCTMAFVEVTDGQPQARPITDIARVLVVWEGVEREAAETEHKGTFTVPCPGRRALPGHYQVTRAGQAPRTIPFSSAAAPDPVPWPSEAETETEATSSSSGSGNTAKSTSPARPAKCQSDPNTVKAIKSALAGKDCTRVSVTVKDHRLSAPSVGISFGDGIDISSRALANCKGRIQCP